MAPQSSMLQIVIGVTESKTSPRHLNFLKQLKKTTEVLLLLRVLVLDTSGHPPSAKQYSNSSKYTTYAHNDQKFGHSLRPLFFFFFFKFTRGSKKNINFDGFSSLSGRGAYLYLATLMNLITLLNLTSHALLKLTA